MSVLTTIVRGLFSAYWYVLLATALVGFVPDLRETQLGRLLGRVTDPYLNLYRRVIRPVVVGQVTLDLSWMIGVAVFFVIEEAVGSVMTRLLVNL
ncbi:YggT family protein [Alicyclobacillus fastidiosus]|uniref:YggT family protein n=1 Tax=Alicyclobacillus fastidiosus TaxID=392011 RepID=A0ABY6ZCB4_9BACL|nr:YggT family protein [Alicyclobacillus fastidiosus]WAH40423.1 YggT family protein [Alicyclobacillus fastidiosus]GMA61820.1 hypothetical protein GCM10025859_22600 [Alicyclobacillus fastidiosus]